MWLVVKKKGIWELDNKKKGIWEINNNETVNQAKLLEHRQGVKKRFFKHHDNDKRHWYATTRLETKNTNEGNKNKTKKKATITEQRNESSNTTGHAHPRTQAPYLIATTGGLQRTEFRLKGPGQSLRARPEHGQHFARVAHGRCVLGVCLSVCSLFCHRVSLSFSLFSFPFLFLDYLLFFL